MSSASSASVEATSVDSVGSGPIDQPVKPSICPSIHQPSSTLKFITPLCAAFMPLVPDASRGLMGVLSHTSTPETIFMARSML